MKPVPTMSLGGEDMVTDHFADLKTKIRFYQIKYEYV